jgi:uncharacterized protein involved in outer membrane biogenesis
MMHHRSKIRHRLVTVLDAIPALTGNVEASRRYPLERGFTMAATVQTLDEAATLDIEDDEDGDGLRRIVRFQIVVSSQDGADPDTALDDIAETIEAAIETDETLQGLVHSIRLDSTRFDIPGADGGEEQPTQPVIRVGFIYTATFFTAAADPARSY